MYSTFSKPDKPLYYSAEFKVSYAIYVYWALQATCRIKTWKKLFCVLIDAII